MSGEDDAPVIATNGRDSTPRLISSSSTCVFKYVLPLALGGWIFFFAAAMASNNALDDAGFLAPFGLAFIGILYLGLPLKEVTLSGTDLIISKGNRSRTVPLASIREVREQFFPYFGIGFHAAKKVTIYFEVDAPFYCISFLPSLRIFPWSEHNVVHELRNLAKEAKNSPAP